MARTAIDINCDALVEVLGQFGMLAINVVGSLPSKEEGTVRLAIEAEWLPEAELVTCEVHRVAVNHVMQLTAKVVPIEPHGDATERGEATTFDREFQEIEDSIRAGARRAPRSFKP